MKNANEYKDIYEIILGIGQKWNDLTDIERASLGEALAGKRASNALFAVLNNVDRLQEVYKTAEDAAGSAEREQENYAKSIQYSIDRFKAVAQEAATSLISSSDAKDIVESAVTGLEGLGKAAVTLEKPLNIILSLVGELLKLIGDISEATNGIAPLAILGGFGIKELDKKFDFGGPQCRVA